MMKRVKQELDPEEYKAFEKASGQYWQVADSDVPTAQETAATKKALDELREFESLSKQYWQKAYSDAWVTEDTNVTKASQGVLKDREDAWALYLGMPQTNHTFGISDYKPKQETEGKYYYKINDFWDRFLDKPGFLGEPESSNHNLSHKIAYLKKEGGRVLEYDTKANGDLAVMGTYTLALGEDEKGSYVGYYDKWDLATAWSTNPVLGGVGRSYEIYDRLYYDPVTFEVKK
jgi:hypothetical protein